MFTARSHFDVHRWERLRKMGQEMGDERIICPAYVSFPFFSTFNIAPQGADG
jgi:hypothetical protein